MISDTVVSNKFPRVFREIPFRKIERILVAKDKITKGETNTFNILSISAPILLFLAISSADEVLRCSIRKFGILNGGTCTLSVLYWCRRGRYLSGLGSERLSSVNLFLWFLQLIETKKLVECEKVKKWKRLGKFWKRARSLKHRSTRKID